MNHKLLIIGAAVTTVFASAWAQTRVRAQASKNPVGIGYSYIPSRAIVLNGDANRADSTVLAVFYSREGLDFNDSDAPRFLLLDREGKIAFGIGGALYATASYDFRGSVDGTGFATYNIPVPNTGAQNQRFGADVGNSSLTAKLVGRSPHFGLFSVYFQAKFTGDNGKYGFKLKQAYATLGHLTAGLATSTFVDANTQAPTIDPQGACGQTTEKNMLFRYCSPSYKGFTYAVSIEVPRVSTTQAPAATNRQNADGTMIAAGQSTSASISQRVPDIPAYLQYGWKGGHVRLSAIFRDLAYRDLITGKNHLEPGWGMQLSAMSMLTPYLQPFGHFCYGKGISQYANDLSGKGFDLIPKDGHPGQLTVAPSMTWTAGTYIYLTKKLFATASFSTARLYDCGHIGGDTYRYATYTAANLFYDFDDNFRLGAEYLHGTRTDYDGRTGSANRINLLMQYSF